MLKPEVEATAEEIAAFVEETMRKSDLGTLSEKAIIKSISAELGAEKGRDYEKSWLTGKIDRVLSTMRAEAEAAARAEAAAAAAANRSARLAMTGPLRSPAAVERAGRDADAAREATARRLEVEIPLRR